MTPLPSPGDGLSALRPFATLRLIALDIDGTLPSASSGEIGGVVSDLQRSLLYSYRVALTVATGRTHRAAQATLQRLRLDRNTNVVLYNGAVGTTVSGDRLWLRSSFSDDDVAAVLQCAGRLQLPAYVFRCWADLLTSSGPGPIRESIVGVSPRIESTLEFGGLPIDWTSSDHAIEDAAAILLPTPNAAVHHQVTMALAETRPTLSIAASSLAYVEVSPPGCSKATALAALAKAKKKPIKREEVAAVGDNGNDVAMLSWAGVGVAVASATEAALQASDYVTRNPAGDGVVELLRLVRDAKRFESVVR